MESSSYDYLLYNQFYFPEQEITEQPPEVQIKYESLPQSKLSPFFISYYRAIYQDEQITYILKDQDEVENINKKRQQYQNAFQKQVQKYIKTELIEGTLNQAKKLAITEKQKENYKYLELNLNQTVLQQKSKDSKTLIAELEYYNQLINLSQPFNTQKDVQIYLQILANRISININKFQQTVKTQYYQNPIPVNLSTNKIYISQTLPQNNNNILQNLEAQIKLQISLTQQPTNSEVFYQQGGQTVQSYSHLNVQNLYTLINSQQDIQSNQIYQSYQLSLATSDIIIKNNKITQFQQQLDQYLNIRLFQQALEQNILTYDQSISDYQEFFSQIINSQYDNIINKTVALTYHQKQTIRNKTKVASDQITDTLQSLITTSDIEILMQRVNIKYSYNEIFQLIFIKQENFIPNPQNFLLQLEQYSKIFIQTQYQKNITNIPTFTNISYESLPQDGKDKIIELLFNLSSPLYIYDKLQEQFYNTNNIQVEVDNKDYENILETLIQQLNSIFFQSLDQNIIYNSLLEQIISLLKTTIDNLIGIDTQKKLNTSSNQYRQILEYLSQNIKSDDENFLNLQLLFQLFFLNYIFSSFITKHHSTEFYQRFTLTQLYIFLQTGLKDTQKQIQTREIFQLYTNNKALDTIFPQLTQLMFLIQIDNNSTKFDLIYNENHIVLLTYITLQTFTINSSIGTKLIDIAQEYDRFISFQNTYYSLITLVENIIRINQFINTLTFTVTEDQTIKTQQDLQKISFQKHIKNQLEYNQIRRRLSGNLQILQLIKDNYNVTKSYYTYVNNFINQTRISYVYSNILQSNQQARQAITIFEQLINICIEYNIFHPMISLSYLQLNILNLFVNNKFLISTPYHTESEQSFITQQYTIPQTGNNLIDEYIEDNIQSYSYFTQYLLLLYTSDDLNASTQIPRYLSQLSFRPTLKYILDGQQNELLYSLNNIFILFSINDLFFHPDIDETSFLINISTININLQTEQLEFNTVKEQLIGLEYVDIYDNILPIENIQQIQKNFIFLTLDNKQIEDIQKSSLYVQYKHQFIISVLYLMRYYIQDLTEVFTHDLLFFKITIIQNKETTKVIEQLINIKQNIINQIQSTKTQITSELSPIEKTEQDIMTIINEKIDQINNKLENQQKLVNKVENNNSQIQEKKFQQSYLDKLIYINQSSQFIINTIYSFLIQATIKQSYVQQSYIQFNPIFFQKIFRDKIEQSVRLIIKSTIEQDVSNNAILTDNLAEKYVLKDINQTLLYSILKKKQTINKKEPQINDPFQDIRNQLQTIENEQIEYQIKKTEQVFQEIESDIIDYSENYGKAFVELLNAKSKKSGDQVIKIFNEQINTLQKQIQDKILEYIVNAKKLLRLYSNSKVRKAKIFIQQFKENMQKMVTKLQDQTKSIIETTVQLRQLKQSSAAFHQVASIQNIVQNQSIILQQIRLISSTVNELTKFAQQESRQSIMGTTKTYNRLNHSIEETLLRTYQLKGNMLNKLSDSDQQLFYNNVRSLAELKYDLIFNKDLSFYQKQ